MGSRKGNSWSLWGWLMVMPQLVLEERMELQGLIQPHFPQFMWLAVLVQLTKPGLGRIRLAQPQHCHPCLEFNSEGISPLFSPFTPSLNFHLMADC